MTIKELIDELSKYNEQLEVLLQTQESEDVGVEPRVVLSHRKSGRSPRRQKARRVRATRAVAAGLAVGSEAPR